ncbi:hypothetical protein SLE2022_328870 [Rubroshorea leprosula]
MLESSLFKDFQKRTAIRIRNRLKCRLLSRFLQISTNFVRMQRRERNAYLKIACRKERCAGDARHRRPSSLKAEWFSFDVCLDLKCQFGAKKR